MYFKLFYLVDVAKRYYAELNAEYFVIYIIYIMYSKHAVFSNVFLSRMVFVTQVSGLNNTRIMNDHGPWSIQVYLTEPIVSVVCKIHCQGGLKDQKTDR